MKDEENTDWSQYVPSFVDRPNGERVVVMTPKAPREARELVRPYADN